MIPILFPEDAVDFTTQGLGALTEAVECTVEEERNGEYFLKMKYPDSGHLYKELLNSRIILATHEYGKGPEPFRICTLSKPVNGIMTVTAEHWSYQLNDIPVSPFTATSAVDVMNKIMANSEEVNPFIYSTDIVRQRTWELPFPMNARGILAGWDQSVLYNFGGELEFTGREVHLWRARGADRGFTIKYGVNLMDVNQQENIANVVTSIYPYYYASDDGTGHSVLVTLPEKIIDSPYTGDYPYRRTAVHDFTERFDHVPTVEELRAWSETYIGYDYIGVPSVSVTVKFAQLSKSPEYAQYKDLETVRLCDTLNIEFERIGIKTTAKVTRVIWNVLLDRYDSITMGDVRSNLAHLMSQQNTIINNTVNTAVNQTYVYNYNIAEQVAQTITGGFGGYVQLHIDPFTGKPDEILIMDTEDITTATKVWRWNQGGLAYSNQGYNPSTFVTAITANGEIVADFISAGTLQGVEIIGESGEIGGWGLSQTELRKTGTFNPDNLEIDIYGAGIIVNYFLGNITEEQAFAQAESNGYLIDIDGDGHLTQNDLYLSYRIILNYIAETFEYKVGISAENPFKAYYIEDESSGETLLQIGAGGIFTNLISTSNLYGGASFPVDVGFSRLRPFSVAEDADSTHTNLDVSGYKWDSTDGLQRVFSIVGNGSVNQTSLVKQDVLRYGGETIEFSDDGRRTYKYTCHREYTGTAGSQGYVPIIKIDFTRTTDVYEDEPFKFWFSQRKKGLCEASIIFNSVSASSGTNVAFIKATGINGVPNVAAKRNGDSIIIYVQKSGTSERITLFGFEVGGFALSRIAITLSPTNVQSVVSLADPKTLSSPAPLLAYEDHTFNISGGIAAGGTIGERVTGVNYTPSRTPISVCISDIGNATYFNPMVFIRSGSVFCNYYRASTSACSEANTKVTVRVFFE